MVFRNIALQANIRLSTAWGELGYKFLLKNEFKAVREDVRALLRGYSLMMDFHD